MSSTTSPSASRAHDATESPGDQGPPSIKDETLTVPEHPPQRKPYVITDEDELVPAWDPSAVDSTIIDTCEKETSAQLDHATGLLNEYRNLTSVHTPMIALHLYTCDDANVELLNVSQLLAKIKGFFSWVKLEVKGSTVMNRESAVSSMGTYKKGIVFGMDKFSEFGITGDYVSNFGKGEMKDAAMGRRQYAPTAPASAKKKFNLEPLTEEALTKGGLWADTDIATAAVRLLVALSAVSFEVHRFMAVKRLRAAVDVYLGEYPHSNAGTTWSIPTDMHEKLHVKIAAALVASGFLHPDSVKKEMEAALREQYEGNDTKAGKAQKADDEKKLRGLYDVWMNNAIGQIDTNTMDACITGLMEYTGKHYVVTNQFKSKSLIGSDKYVDMTVSGTANVYISNPDRTPSRNAMTKAYWETAGKQHMKMVTDANTKGGKPVSDRYTSGNKMDKVDPMFEEFVDIACNPKNNWVAIGPMHAKGVRVLDRKGRVVNGRQMEDGDGFNKGDERPLNLREYMECMSALQRGLMVVEGGLNTIDGAKFGAFVWMNVHSVQSVLHGDAMQCLAGWTSSDYFDWTDPYNDMGSIMCRRDAPDRLTLQLIQGDMVDANAEYMPPPTSQMMAICAADVGGIDADANTCDVSVGSRGKRKHLEITEGDPIEDETGPTETKRVCGGSSDDARTCSE